MCSSIYDGRSSDFPVITDGWEPIHTVEQGAMTGMLPWRRGAGCLCGSACTVWDALVMAGRWRSCPPGMQRLWLVYVSVRGVRESVSVEVTGVWDVLPSCWGGVCNSWPGGNCCVWTSPPLSSEFGRQALTLLFHLLCLLLFSAPGVRRMGGFSSSWGLLGVGGMCDKTGALQGSGVVRGSPARVSRALGYVRDGQCRVARWRGRRVPVTAVLPCWGRRRTPQFRLISVTLLTHVDGHMQTCTRSGRITFVGSLLCCSTL